MIYIETRSTYIVVIGLPRLKSDIFPWKSDYVNGLNDFLKFEHMSSLSEANGTLKYYKHIFFINNTVNISKIIININTLTLCRPPDLALQSVLLALLSRGAELTFKT